MKRTSYYSTLFRTSLYFLSSFILILFISGCDTLNKPETEVQEATTNADVHVAFAGGGWRAHTGHTAWVASLLQVIKEQGCDLPSNGGNPECLKSAFSNVFTISGNSGGAWFSSLLMYDADFVNQITNGDIVKNWGYNKSGNTNQGWLGKQNMIFDGFNSKCGDKKGSAYLTCILEDIFGGTGTLPTPDYSDFVAQTVYKDYKWKNYQNLNSDTHQPWAKNKSLLMAGTLLTNTVLLNYQDDEVYYQVCPSPLIVNTDGDSGGKCVDSVGFKKPNPDVIPVTFTSLANNDKLKAPSFISTKPNTFGLGYSGAAYSPTAKTNTLVSGNNNAGNVPVMRAATASSSAGGYTASYTLPDPALPAKCDLAYWLCIYHLRNMAVGFKIPNASNQVAYVENATMDGRSVADLTSDRAFRVADGGVVDNSAIIQLIRYLQLNGLDNNFNIVAFDDVKSNDSNDQNLFPSSDISYLFQGAPSKGVCVQGVCVQVPELAVVDENKSAPSTFKKYEWAVRDPSGHKTNDSLFYYTYEVVTVANDNFNIKAGSKGTIHVFASQFGCADTAPENQGDFPCYNEMIANFNPTLKLKPDNTTTGDNGFAMLAKAFGVYK